MALGPQFEVQTSDKERPKRGSIVPPGTVLYRGEKGQPKGSAGIHWSLSESVAKNFAGSEGRVHSVEITDPVNQVIPYGALENVNYHPDRGVWHDPSGWDQGYPFEKEVRLRPGAKFRTLEGLDIEISGTHKEHLNYPGLHNYAVTPESSNKEYFHTISRLGHTQPALFDEIVLEKDADEHVATGGAKVSGYIPSWETRSGDVFERARGIHADVGELAGSPDQEFMQISMGQYFHPTHPKDVPPKKDDLKEGPPKHLSPQFDGHPRLF